jgi:hypothetical protein
MVGMRGQRRVKCGRWCWRPSALTLTLSQRERD